jgi:hypothetical protein
MYKGGGYKRHDVLGPPQLMQSTFQTRPQVTPPVAALFDQWGELYGAGPIRAHVLFTPRLEDLGIPASAGRLASHPHNGDNSFAPGA